MGIKELKEIWPGILQYMREEYDISDVSFRTWLDPLLIYSCDGRKIILIVSDTVTRDYLQKRYHKMLQVAIEEKTGISFELCFLLQEEIDSQKNGTEEKTKKLIHTPEDVNEELLRKANLNPKYTFDNFVVGPNNNLAHAAAVAVAESPGQAYKILYIYGGVGLGKTHLMHAVAHYILKNNPSSNILYVTSETFTTDYIESIRNNNVKGGFNTSDFRNKYRDLDVLLIDDIQFITGKVSTQEEFFHTFNALNERNKQIIISSDKPPKAIEGLEERLRSRFEWGLMVDIQPPDFETRIAILRKKENLEGYNIDNEVIKYIATNIKSNIRELEGALTRIVAKSRLEHISIDVEMAERILSDYIGNTEGKKELTPERIIKTVADHFSLSVLEICSQKKVKEITYPRQIAMYLCCTMTNVPLEQIGKALGGRDHSTIMHGRDKISNALNKDQQLRSVIEILQKKLSPQ